MGIDIKKMKKEELIWLQYLLAWTKDRLTYDLPCTLNFDSEEIFPAVKGLTLLESERIIEFTKPEEFEKNCYLVDVSVPDQINFDRFLLEVENELHFHKTKYRIGSKKDGHKIPSIEVPEGTVWGDVRIDFVSQDMVTLSIKGKKESKKFSDMGFTDLRKKIFPGDLWLILKFLGAFNGEINPDNKKKLPKPMQNNLKKWISLLRKKLKEYFPIAGDPFEPCPRYNEYRTNRGIQTSKPGAVYRAKFHVSFTEQGISESTFQTKEVSPFDEASKRQKHLSAEEEDEFYQLNRQNNSTEDKENQ